MTDTQQFQISNPTSIAELEGWHPAEGTIVTLDAGGRSGKFRGTTTDISTEVAADTEQGIYIAAFDDATGASGGWVRQYGQGVYLSPEISTSWFGTVADGSTDDSDAINAAIQYSYSRGNTIDQFTSGLSIYIPGSSGTYRIDQPDVLFTGVSGGCFKVRGDGYKAAGRSGATVLEFNPSADLPTNYMINNEDFGFTSFEDIGFKSVNGSTFMRAENQPDGNGWVQNFSFSRCSWNGFVDLFKIEGASLTSEWTFNDCRFRGFSGTGFSFDNVQSVNWNFYACQATVFSGTLFEWLQGNTVTWYGGNIIPTDDAAILFSVPGGADSSTFSTNQMHNFLGSGVHLEMRDEATFVQKDQAACNFALKFHDSSMGGSNITAMHKTIQWSGKGRLIFDGCGNLGGYRMDYDTDSSNSFRQLTVVAENCHELSQGFITGSTFTDVSSEPVRRPRFKIRNCNYEMDGDYIITSAETGDSVMQWRSIYPLVSSTADFQTGYYSGGWAISEDIPVPPAVIHAIRFYPVALAGFGAITSTIVIKDAGGTTLGTLTWDGDTPANLYEEIEIRHSVDYDDPRIIMEFSSDYTGSGLYRWKGRMMAMY